MDNDTKTLTEPSDDSKDKLLFEADLLNMPNRDGTVPADNEEIKDDDVFHCLKPKCKRRLPMTRKYSYQHHSRVHPGNEKREFIRCVGARCKENHER